MAEPAKRPRVRSVERFPKGWWCTFVYKGKQRVGVVEKFGPAGVDIRLNKRRGHWGSMIHLDLRETRSVGFKAIDSPYARPRPVQQTAASIGRLH